MDIVRLVPSVHETAKLLRPVPQDPRGSIRVTARDVGGGFGQKMSSLAKSAP